MIKYKCGVCFFMHWKEWMVMENEKITLKNTKTEILDALNAALEREKNMSKIKSNPVAE